MTGTTMYYDSSRKKFRVQVGKNIHIGRYKNKETALLIRKAVAKAYRAGRESK